MRPLFKFIIEEFILKNKSTIISFFTHFINTKVKCLNCNFLGFYHREDSGKRGILKICHRCFTRILVCREVILLSFGMIFWIRGLDQHNGPFLMFLGSRSHQAFQLLCIQKKVMWIILIVILKILFQLLRQDRAYPRGKPQPRMLRRIISFFLILC